MLAGEGSVINGASQSVFGLLHFLVQNGLSQLGQGLVFSGTTALNELYDITFLEQYYQNTAPLKKFRTMSRHGINRIFFAYSN